MKLDHATIVGKDLPSLRHFFRDVAGLGEGHRPPFSVEGYWLYDNERPLIHLVDATLPSVEGKNVPRIDHIALRIDSPAEWSALIDRMQSHRIFYQIVEVPLTAEIQLFVTLAPNLVIEFVASAHRVVA
jgi:catechol 2,3-dioxygenase-like lactoylglutathione lyase family enzyme